MQEPFLPMVAPPAKSCGCRNCGRGRCELPVIVRLNTKSRDCDLVVAGKGKNLAISATEMLRARLRAGQRGRCDFAVQALCCSAKNTLLSRALGL